MEFIVTKRREEELFVRSLSSPPWQASSLMVMMSDARVLHARALNFLGSAPCLLGLSPLILLSTMHTEPISLLALLLCTVLDIVTSLYAGVLATINLFEIVVIELWQANGMAR